MNNSKEFWKYCKSANSKKNAVNLDFENFTNFFKELNKKKSTCTNLTQTNPNDTNNTHVLDRKITEAEIRKSIANLKNGDSSGLDKIKNEYIKASTDKMLPTYLLLFNLIYEHGILPESWTTGTIKPIYKNKGPVNDPNNYRPITVLSCMSKLFSSVINTKLTNYLNDQKNSGRGANWF